MTSGKQVAESGIHEDQDDEQPDERTFSGVSDSSDGTSDGHNDSSGNPVMYPPPTAPYAVAKRLYEGCRDQDGVRNLLAYRSDWQLWRKTHWSEVDAAEVRSRIYRALEHAIYIKDSGKLEPWNPSRHKVRERYGGNGGDRAPVIAL